MGSCTLGTAAGRSLLVSFSSRMPLLFVGATVVGDDVPGCSSNLPLSLLVTAVGVLKGMEEAAGYANANLTTGSVHMTRTQSE